MKVFSKFFKQICIKLGISHFFRIKRSGYYLYAYPSSLSKALWFDPFCRYETERFFQRYLRQNDVVVDVGANIGTLTLEASVIVGANGRVYSVEAHPKLFRYLEGNLALNHTTNAIVLNLALGNEEKTVFFSDRHDDDTQNRVVTQEDGVAVLQKRLDDVGIQGPVHLLKIDVEGYEKFVLEGGERLLLNTHCVYLEWSNEHFTKYGYNSQELWNYFQERDFALFRWLSNSMQRILSSDMLRGRENLIATRDENYVRERLDRTYV